MDHNRINIAFGGGGGSGGSAPGAYGGGPQPMFNLEIASVGYITHGGNMPKAPAAPVKTFVNLTISRCMNGYLVHTSDPHRGAVCGGDMYVFQTIAALNTWLGKHFPQPK